MKDDANTPASLKGGKGKKGKEGEEEMTVVVPPSKGQKGLSKKDNDGDVAMDGEEAVEDEGAVKEDPVVKTVAGMFAESFKSFLLRTVY